MPLSVLSPNQVREILVRLSSLQTHCKAGQYKLALPPDSKIDAREGKDPFRHNRESDTTQHNLRPRMLPNDVHEFDEFGDK